MAIKSISGFLNEMLLNASDKIARPGFGDVWW
jgi:hypothetical protein